MYFGILFLSTCHNHKELIASKLQACLDGQIKRLIINLPPRNLKSHAATICFPAYVLGHKPSAQIICVSYGQQLADKHSLDCRTLMNSEWYRGVFGVRLSPGEGFGHRDAEPGRLGTVGPQAEEADVE